MWLLLVALAVVTCSNGASPPAPRRRPEHPDGGTPPDDPDAAGAIDGGNDGVTPDAGDPTEEAREKIGDHFDLFIHADKAGREGCGTIRVENIIYNPVVGKENKGKIQIAILSISSSVSLSLVRS